MSTVTIRIYTDKEEAADAVRILTQQKLRVSVSENDETVRIFLNDVSYADAIHGESIWTVLATEEKLTTFAP